MDKELLLIHANCQGEPLAWFLGRLPGVAERFEIRLVTNFQGELLPDELLSRCNVFLYQHLGENWGELASELVKKRLPASCQTLSFPSMFFREYWPFWGHVADWEFPDTLLDSLLDKGLPPAEVKRVYLRSGVVPAHDFEAMTQASIDRERIKEQFTPIKHVERMLEGRKETMVFNTANHPGHELLCWLGKRVLEELGWDLPDEGVVAFMPQLHPEFKLPIHPLVAEARGLKFAGWETKYPVYGRKLTFEQYVDEYLLARMNGFNEFISYLCVRGGHDALGQKASGQENGS